MFDTRSKVEALERKHMWKQVDILVNNAGICPREDLLDYPAVDGGWLAW